MSNLSCRSVRTAPNFTSQYDAAADTRSQRHTHNVATSAGGAEPHLTHRRGVRIVFENDGQTQTVLQDLFQSEVDERRKVWRRQNDCLSSINRAGDHHRRSDDWTI